MSEPCPAKDGRGRPCTRTDPHGDGEHSNWDGSFYSDKLYNPDPPSVSFSISVEGDELVVERRTPNEFGGWRTTWCTLGTVLPDGTVKFYSASSDRWQA